MRHRVWYRWGRLQGYSESVPTWTMWRRDYNRSPEGFQPDTDDAFPNFLEADRFAQWRNREHVDNDVLFQAFPIGHDPNL